MLCHCSHREDNEDGEDDGMIKMMGMFALTFLFARSFRLGKALSD